MIIVNPLYAHNCSKFHTIARSFGRPTSMRYINGRKLRTVGDYRNLSPAERAYLDDQERCWK